MDKVEQYALGLLAEEPSELIQMVGKWLRFGPDHARNDGLTARRGLSLEAGDTLAAMDWAIAAGVLDVEVMMQQCSKKLARLCDPDAVDDEGRRLAPELANPPATIEALQAQVAAKDAALAVANTAINEMFRYYDGGETRGSYDGKPERNQLRKAGYVVRAALGQGEG